MHNVFANVPAPIYSYVPVVRSTAADLWMCSYVPLGILDIYYIVYVCVVWLLYYSLTYPKIANFLFAYGGQNHGKELLMNTKCLPSSQKCTWRHSGKRRLMEHPTAFVTHHDLWNTIQLIEHNTIRGAHHTTTWGTHHTTTYGTYHDSGNTRHDDLWNTPRLWKHTTPRIIEQDVYRPWTLYVQLYINTNICT